VANSICSCCNSLIQSNTIRCGHCGCKIGLHLIVPDGCKYGIAVRNKVRIRGLELKRAQELVSVLNIA
jgi:hypothetical protein